MESIVNNNLKALRENSGYTQKQLAEFLGLNRSAYANYEAGEMVSTLSVLEGVAKLFGVDVYMLFETEPEAIRSSLLCAFRADDLTADDMRQVADFKDIAMSYLKMVKLLENE